MQVFIFIFHKKTYEKREEHEPPRDLDRRKSEVAQCLLKKPSFVLATNAPQLPYYLAYHGFQGKGVVKRFSEGLIFHVPYENGIALKRAHSAIIIDNFKLIKFHDTNELLLFNVTQDLEEKKNLALILPEKLKTLEVALDRYLQDVKAPKWQPGINWKNKLIEKFNSYHQLI